MLSTSEIGSLFDTGYCKGQSGLMGTLKCLGSAGDVIRKDRNGTGFELCASLAICSTGVSVGITTEVLWRIRRRYVIAREIAAIRKRIIENRFDRTCEDESLAVLLMLPRTWADQSSAKLRMLQLVTAEYFDSYETKRGFQSAAAGDSAGERYEEIKQKLFRDFDDLIRWAVADERQNISLEYERDVRNRARAVPSADARAIIANSGGYLTDPKEQRDAWCGQ